MSEKWFHLGTQTLCARAAHVRQTQLRSINEIMVAIHIVTLWVSQHVSKWDTQPLSWGKACQNISAHFINSLSLRGITGCPLWTSRAQNKGLLDESRMIVRTGPSWPLKVFVGSAVFQLVSVVTSGKGKKFTSDTEFEGSQTVTGTCLASENEQFWSTTINLKGNTSKQEEKQSR